MSKPGMLIVASEVACCNENSSTLLFRISSSSIKLISSSSSCSLFFKSTVDCLLTTEAHVIILSLPTTLDLTREAFSLSRFTVMLKGPSTWKEDRHQYISISIYEEDGKVAFKKESSSMFQYIELFILSRLDLSSVLCVVFDPL